jgi:Helix-turn-helix domain
MSRPKLIDATEAAVRLGVHQKTFARYVRAGLIVAAVPGRKGRGGSALYSRESIDRIRDQREPKPPAVEPPAPVDLPVSPERHQRIEAALQNTGRSPKWLEDVGDRWLAQAARVDPAKVKDGKQRNPHRRERDLNDHDGVTVIPWKSVPEFGIDVEDGGDDTD